MAAYYNEIDPYAATWLRNLISAGHIADGVVDERSIEDIYPIELREFTQCHFFAGIGVWSRALRTADWADDRPVWTGSCPCQPFSSAGQGAGFDDERHLWPAFHHLIAECRPAVVFGEQVASKDADPWIDLVHADLEALGYTFGAVPFPAAGIGAPHIRDRLYWGAHAGHEFGGLVNTAHVHSERSPEAGGLGGAQCSEHNEARQRDGKAPRASGAIYGASAASPTNSHWRNADWLFCRDEKWRAVEPGTFPLADGVTGRVGRLRAYGNAIVPQAAAAFIRAYC